jgi:hypothetical protein
MTKNWKNTLEKLSFFNQLTGEALSPQKEHLTMQKMEIIGN